MAKKWYVGASMRGSLGNVPEGEIVKLNENGVQVDFYVACHNYESARNGNGRTLLVRKNCRKESGVWSDSRVNAYASSTIDSWLNGTYKSLFDPAIQEAIGTTKFPYTIGNNNWSVSELSRSVFLLSVTELGKTPVKANTEGSALPIASTLEIAKYNGSAVTQWTRSPGKVTSNDVFCVRDDGVALTNFADAIHFPRPAFTLPSTLSVKDGFIDGSPAGTIPNIAREVKKPYVGVTNTVYRNLPAGYTQLEYIEGTGTQYADIGIVPDGNTKVVLDFQMTSPSTANECIFGTSGQFSFRWYGENSCFRSNGKVAAGFPNTISPTSRHVVVKETLVTTIDDFYTVTTEPGTNLKSIYLLANNNNGEVIQFAKCRVFASQTYVNGVLVRDYVPCKKADGTAGLYNMANGAFTGSAGADAFVAGPEVTQGSVARKVSKGYVGVGGVARKFFGGNPMWQMPVRSIVKLNEDGVPAEFYIACHDYESSRNGAGRTLLVRKNLLAPRVWHGTEKSAYATSSIDTWLNDTYKLRLDADVQTVIGQTTFPYTIGDGNATLTTLSRSVFLLSGTELGVTYSNGLGQAMNVEGSSLPMAYDLQVPDPSKAQWTRSPLTLGVSIRQCVIIVRADRTADFKSTSTHSNFICPRPAFTVPSNRVVIDSNGFVVPI